MRWLVPTWQGTWLRAQHHDTEPLVLQPLGHQHWNSSSLTQGTVGGAQCRLRTGWREPWLSGWAQTLLSFRLCNLL